TYTAHMRLAQQAWQDANLLRMTDLLARHEPKPGRPDRRGWEWYYLRSLLQKGRTFACAPGEWMYEGRATSWSPTVALLAWSTKEQGVVEVCDLATKRPSFFLRGHSGRVVRLLWRPDGRRLAVGKIQCVL